MIDLYALVAKCYAKFGLHSPMNPAPLSEEETEFRVAAMKEELQEYEDAQNREEELDALVDLTVFAIGTAYRHGFQRFNEAFRRVVEANERKQLGPNQKRGGFELDLVKPPGWKPADLRDLVSPRANYAPRIPRSDATVGSGDECEFTLRATPERFKAADLDHVPGSPKYLRVTLRPGKNPLFTATDDPSPGVLSQDLADEVGAGWETHPALHEANVLQMRKSQDYGARDWAKEAYHPFGDASYLQMLHTKMERVKSIRLSENANPNFEGARDTLLDLINYASFYVAWLDSQVPDEEEDE